MNVLAQLPRPFFVLAPMDDVTDTVFRQIIADCARPDLFFTEFVNVDGLQSPGRERIARRIQFTSKEQPIIAQIWGKEPANFYKTAQELVGMGFAGIDLNMGCPEKTVVKNGACSALINNRPLASEIIKATQAGAAGRVPVSVKTRLGFNEIDLSWPAFLLDHDLAMLTIHGRTRKEMSDVPAHWDQIGEVRRLRDRIALETLIVGNGDVQNRAQAQQLAETYQLDGVMIGRGIFHDPFAFAKESPWTAYTKAQRVELYAEHVKLFVATWSGYNLRVPVLNKFCKIYISGFEGAKELRDQLMHAKDADDLLRMLAAI